jgi:hypothetical protein
MLRSARLHEPRTRLWRDQGKVQQAREVLARLCGCFTEGFDTRDLKDAKTLPASTALAFSIPPLISIMKHMRISARAKTGACVSRS